MPFLAPSFARLPPLAFLVADQVESRNHIARHLGVSLRTLQRYQASGNAPRAVYLALWFESRWGMAALHTQAYNEAQHARAWVASLERECERLRDVIRVYENTQAQPAANAPAYHLVQSTKGARTGRGHVGPRAGRTCCRRLAPRRPPGHRDGGRPHCGRTRAGHDRRRPPEHTRALDAPPAPSDVAPALFADH
jgi:hypothetical protein